MNPPEESRLLESARGKIETLVTTHLAELALQRMRGIRIFPDGSYDASQWIRYCQRFADQKIRPALNDSEAGAVGRAGLSRLATELLEEPVRKECRRLEVLNQNRPIAARSPGVSARKTRSPRQIRTASESTLASGLIIRSDPLARILGGQKDWEMRTARTSRRGTIALILQGAKSVLGVADIADCRGPLSRAEMVATVRHHGIEERRLDNPEVAKWRFAWVLSNVRRLRRPVPCPVNPGAVIFVTLDESTRQTILQQL